MASPLGEPEADQAPAAAFFHVGLERLNGVPAGLDRLWFPRSGRQQHQAVVDGRCQPGSRGQCVVAPLKGSPKLVAVLGPCGDVFTEMGEGERDMSGFVGEGQVGDAGSDRVGRVGLEKGQQRQEGAFTERREEERGVGPVRLVRAGVWSDARPPAPEIPGR